MNLTRKFKSVALAIAGVILVPSCASTGNANTKHQTNPTDSQFAVKSVQHGKASWYSVRTNYGTRTASGQRLSNDAATAAHKTLPMGTKVRVTCLKSGRCTVVRINDRGPFVRGRIIDLTPAAAAQIGLTRSIGLTKVELAVMH